jgi:hypothetical protein
VEPVPSFRDVCVYVYELLGVVKPGVDPLGALPGSDPPSAGAPRAKGVVLGESTSSIGTVGQREEMAMERG